MSKNPYESPWRKLAIAVYGAPNEGKVYGTYEIDVSKMLDYIEKKKDEGTRITVTNFVTAALARSLYEDAPEMNCFVQRGKLVPREDANVCVSIARKGGKGMTGLVIPKTHEMSVSEIAEYQQNRLSQKRSGKEKGTFGAKNAIAKVPWPFRRPVFKFVKWWAFEMGFKIPFVKIGRDPFGSIMLTNIGTFGLETGMVALFPIGKLPAVIAMGKIKEKPVAVDGEVKIRPMLPLTGTFDHRIADGGKIGDLANGIIDRLKNPAKLDQHNK